jgi:ubiquinone/menaquinone biosynthesis C-methylase UbiE
MTALAPVALALALVGAAGASGAAGAQSRFPDPDRPVASVFSGEYSDEKTRDGHGEAERVMNHLGIRPGLRVADIGAGKGYYTVRLARRLGRDATIYAEDISADYLHELEARLRRERISGVKIVVGVPRDPRLPAASIDVAILSHVYHEIENPYEFFYNLHRSLAPQARVAIIDNDKPTQSHGTPPKLLRCELRAAGYREAGFWPLKPADGYLMVFTPPDQLPPVESIRACTQ